MTKAKRFIIDDIDESLANEFVLLSAHRHEIAWRDSAYEYLEKVNAENLLVIEKLRSQRDELIDTMPRSMMGDRDDAKKYYDAKLKPIDTPIESESRIYQTLEPGKDITYDEHVQIEQMKANGGKL